MPLEKSSFIGGKIWQNRARTKGALTALRTRVLTALGEGTILRENTYTRRNGRPLADTKQNSGCFRMYEYRVHSKKKIFFFFSSRVCECVKVPGTHDNKTIFFFLIPCVRVREGAGYTSTNIFLLIPCVRVPGTHEQIFFLIPCVRGAGYTLQTFFLIPCV